MTLETQNNAEQRENPQPANKTNPKTRILTKKQRKNVLSEFIGTQRDAYRRVERQDDECNSYFGLF